jgi:predicted O-methyltransferase YrrM
LGDVLVVLKTAQGFHSKRILELGSYRGDTARMLAENTGEDVTICAVDIDARHGEAYRGKPIERKIVRKTGHISTDLFASDEKYDFIFVDANHDFASVMNDTEVAFKILAEQGVILWHDYAMDSYFHGLNCVAEALNYFSKNHSIYAIRGTRLAIMSKYNRWETSTLAARMKQSSANSVWEEKQIRG